MTGPMHYSEDIILKVKDHSVSRESFSLVQNPKYGFLETLPQPSVDELPKYYESEEYISHTNSRRNSFERIYHVVRSYTLKRKVSLINSRSGNGRHLLDFGCGTGDFLITAKAAGWTVLGIEPNSKARNIANKVIEAGVKNSEEFFKLGQDGFDVITLWHVLEHLPNLDKYISQFENILKNKGILIVAVPNHKCYDAKHYKEFWAAYDVPRHLWHFCKDSVAKLFGEYGFEIIETKAMWFDSFYVSLLSEKYKTGKMNMIRGLCVGLLSNMISIWTKEPSSVIYILRKTRN